MKKCFLLILLLPLVLSCTGYLNKEVAQKRVSYPRNNVRGYVMTMEELEEFALNLPSMFSNNPKTKTEEGQKWIKDITPLKKNLLETRGDDRRNGGYDGLYLSRKLWR